MKKLHFRFVFYAHYGIFRRVLKSRIGHIMFIRYARRKEAKMENGDILISLCDDFVLEYRLCGNIIAVTKRYEDGKSECEVVFTRLEGEKLRKLCGMLWAARATPKTAKELAEDIEV